MTPDLVAMAPNIVSALGMLAVAIAVFVFARMRLGPVWGAMAIGGGLWVFAIALKVAWALSFNTPVYTALTGSLPAGVGAGAFFVYIGLLTGIFECLVVYLIALYVGPVRRLDREGALALGVGFGGTEAALLGIGALANWLVVIMAPASIPPEALAALGPIDWTIAPAAGVERATAIAVHVFSCTAILLAARTGAVRWLWVAFAMKTGLDTVAVWAGLGYGLTTAAHVWTVEAILAVFGLLSVWGLVVLVPRWPAEGAGEAG
jgi:uncharacterized membrane protein YhfC